jgi:hypothetical protein
MARYNTVLTSGSTATGTTFSTPAQGLLTTLTGTAPYTVTLAAPGLYSGISQTFFNNSTGTITISTPSGNILGAGFTSASSQTIPQSATYTITSDGTNYVIVNNEGGPMITQALTTNGLVTVNSGLTASPANANVTLSPSGSGTVTINPATTGSLNNITIGGSTAANGTFNTITLNTSLTGSGSIDGGTF